MSDNLLFTLLGIDEASPAFDKAGKGATQLADKLDKFGKVSLKSMAIAEGASVGAAAAIGGSMLAAGLTFVAAGAYFASGNEQVAKSFQNTQETVLQSLERDTQMFVPVLQNAATSLMATYGQIEPLTRQAFAASAPYLDQTIHGVEQLALNAMPGLVGAVKGAGPVFSGFDSMLGSVGAGLGGFFQRITAGAPQAGTVFASLGDTLRQELPQIGTLLVTLSNLAANTLPHLGSSLVGVTGAVNGLGAGAVPVLSGSIGFALNVIDGLVAVLGPFESQLGGVIGVVVSAGAAFKVFKTGADLVSNMSTQFAGFGSRAKDAMSKAEGFGGKAGALAGMLGGPLGIAAAGATVVLGVLGAAQQAAAKKTQDHAKLVETLTSALRDSNGAIDANARAQFAATDAAKAAIAMGKELGITANDVIDAGLGQGQVFDKVKTGLEGVIEAGTHTVTNQGRMATEMGKTSTVTDSSAQKAKAFLDALTDLNGGTKQSIAAQQEYSSSLQSTHQSLLNTSAAGVALNADFSKLKDTTSDTAERANALIDALDQLAGGHLSLERAQNEVLDSLDQLPQAFKDAAAAAQTHKVAMIDASGAINRTTEEGRKLFDRLDQLHDSTVKNAQSAYDFAINAGKTVPEALKAAQDVMQSSRDKAIKLAEDLHVPADAAKLMADHMELIPDIVSTLIQTPGMDATQLELAKLKGQFDSVPGQKSITVTSLSDEAQAKLEILGFTVKRLPDGRVTVTANTSSATDSLNALTKPRTVDIYARIVNPSVGHTGMGYADGGFMPAGGPFLVGERGPELIFPQRAGAVMTNSDTRRFLGALNRGAGLMPSTVGAVPTGAMAGAGGGVTIQVGDINVSGAQGPQQTADEIRRMLLTLKRDLGGGSLGLD